MAEKPKDESQEGRWVMTSQVVKSPWRLTFFIGAITVAEISFVAKKPHLYMWHKNEGPFTTVSDAMKRMHQLLKLPPVEQDATDGLC